MLKSILVGLDGSSYTTRAVTLGIQWAQAHDACLIGMGIVDEPGVRQGEALPIGAGMFKEHRDQVKLEKLQRKVERELEKFGKECKKAKVRYKLLEEVGVPYEEILRDSQRYDLILLGQQTYFEYDDDEEYPGKTIHEVVKNSSRPVLTVPKRLTEGDSIAVAFDGSLQAAHALQFCQLLDIYPDTPVHILTIHDEEEEGALIADRAVEYLTYHEREVIPHVLPEKGSVGETLLKQARKLKAQVLVMGAYGESRLSSFFFGSVTKTVLKKATMPLLLSH